MPVSFCLLLPFFLFSIDKGTTYQITITVPQVETVTEREVCAILFKVDKPTTITIERYIL